MNSGNGMRNKIVGSLLAFAVGVATTIATIGVTRVSNMMFAASGQTAELAQLNRSVDRLSDDISKHTLAREVMLSRLTGLEESKISHKEAREEHARMLDQLTATLKELAKSEEMQRRELRSSLELLRLKVEEALGIQLRGGHRP